MFGPRLSRIFASRNNALLWSAMVLVTAYCVAADPPAPDVALTVDQAPPTDPWADRTNEQ